jgi:hypothetical protein
VILFYDDEPDEVINFFVYCANLLPTELSTTSAPTFQVVHVYGNGPNEERILKKTVTKALANVSSLLPGTDGILLLSFTCF